MQGIECNICGKTFKSNEGLEMHTKAKHSKPEKKPSGISSTQKKKIAGWAIVVAIILLIGFLAFYSIASIKVLPPTDITGHIEANPSSHVLKEPMPIEIQKHMLEHADGTGPPGVVVNYNCIDYSCEAGLIEKLEAFAGKYSYVYVAPFPNMDAKIALTRYGKIDVLDSYDEARIENFIKGLV